MTAIISITDAIKVSKELLLGGVTPDFVMVALVADGFDNKKAETILSWAARDVLRSFEYTPDLIA